MNSTCGTSLAPTIAGKPNPQPCRLEITFTPITGFSNMPSSLQINYTSKGQGQQVNVPVTGISVKEPSLAFDSTAYTLAGSIAAGAKSSGNTPLYGQLVLVLRYNGDLAPASTPFPSLDFSTPIGNVSPNTGLGATLNFSQLQMNASNPSYQAALNSAVGNSSSAGPITTASTIFSLNQQQDLTQMNPPLTPPVNPLVPVTSGQPNLLSPCISTATQGGTVIHHSCYVIVSFAPTFTTTAFTENTAPTASNWAATFVANLLLQWNYASSVLSSYQRRTETSVAGLGLNGVNLQSLKMTYRFGTDSTGQPTGPFALTNSNASANIAVSPALNSDGTSWGVPVQIQVQDSSGVPAENVVVSGLPLPNTPLASNKFYYQSNADISHTTCLSGTNIPTSGCVIYLHFAPSPADYFSNPSHSYSESFSSPPIQISYNYATYDVLSGSQISPVNIAFTANAVAPAYLTASATSVNIATSSLFCSGSGSTTITNSGGIVATDVIQTLGQNPGKIAPGACNATIPANASCTVNASYTPVTTSQASVIQTTTYLTGTTSVYGSPGPSASSSVAVTFTGTGSTNSILANGFSGSLTLAANATGANQVSSCIASSTNATHFTFTVCGENPFNFNLTVDNPAISVSNVSCSEPLSSPVSTGPNITGGTVTPSSSQQSSTSCGYTLTGTVPATCSSYTQNTGSLTLNLTTVPNDQTSSTTSTTTIPVNYSYAPPATAIWAVPIPLPVPSWNPTNSNLNFGSVKVGSSLQGTVQLKNVSNYFPLTVTSLNTTPAVTGSVNPSNLSSFTQPTTIAAGGTAPFSNSFTPSGTGTITNTVNVNYTDNNGAAQTVTPMTENATGDGSVSITSLSTTTVSFKTFYTGGVTNSNPSVPVTVAFLGNYASWNSFNTSGLPSWVTLDASSTCLSTNPVPVATAGTGSKTCTLIFDFNSANAPSTLGLNSVPFNMTYNSASGTPANFPSILFQVTVAAPSTTLAINSSSLNFGTAYTNGQTSTSSSQAVTLTATGNYTGWNGPLTPSSITGLPSWLSVDTNTTNSSCFSTSPTPGVSSSGSPCTLNFILGAAPTATGSYSSTISIPYKTQATASPSNLSLTVGLTVSNPVSSLGFYDSNGNSLASIAFGKQMVNKTYAAGTYPYNFMLNFLPQNLWANSLGNPTSSFNQGAGYSCQTINLKNTASGTGAVAAGSISLKLTNGGTDIVLTNATNGGTLLSTPCVDKNGNTTTATLNPGSSCQLSLCFAPSAVESFTSSSNITLGGTYLPSGGTSQTLSSLNVTGTGVGPAQVFATGQWTVIVDGLGQVRVAGTGGYNGLNTPGITGIQKASMGDFGYCQIVNAALECASAPNAASSSFTAVSFPSAATPTDVAVGYNHACALVSSSGTSEVYCWGNNNYGQLGIGTSMNTTTLTYTTSSPQLVTFETGEAPIAVSAGFGYSCAVLTKSGSTLTRCWGAASQGQIGIGINPPLFRANSVVPDPLYFGADYDATRSSGPTCSTTSLATNVTPAIYQTPDVCSNPTGALLPSPVIQTTTGLEPAALAVSAGHSGADQYNCATLTDNTVRCFGQNTDNSNTQFSGLLGPGLSNSNYGLQVADMSSLPSVPLPNYNSAKASQVQLGMGINYACALYPRTLGTSPTGIFCWGEMDNSQEKACNLGASSSDFVDTNAAYLGVPYASPVMLSSGFNHACTVTSDNKVYCWGYPDGFGNITATAAGQAGPFGVYKIFDAMQ